MSDLQFVLGLAASIVAVGVVFCFAIVVAGLRKNRRK